MRFDFGDAAAVIGFLGVMHKLYRGYQGYSGATSQYDGASTARTQSLQSNGGSLEHVKRQMLSEDVKRKLLNIESADARAKFIKGMIEQWGLDPNVRKITGDLLTGRMDSWGRVKNDNQFHAFRRSQFQRFGQPWAVREKDWPAEVKKIFEFIRMQVRYTRDPAARDTYTSPPRTLGFYNIGDCDCYTILAGAMLRSIGYPVRIRIIWIRGQETWGHIYLMVGMPPTGVTHWVPFDASVDKPLGTQAPKAMVYRYKDFEVRG